MSSTVFGRLMLVLAVGSLGGPARVLGEESSDAAVEFLVQALRDSELEVRREAVLSLGELPGAAPVVVRALVQATQELAGSPLNALLDRLSASGWRLAGTESRAAPERPETRYLFSRSVGEASGPRGEAPPAMAAAPAAAEPLAADE